MTSENEENKNLQNRIRQLEREKIELSSKVAHLNIENQNLQNSLDTCNDQNTICNGPIVGKNGLSLLKKPSEIEFCQDYGIYDEPVNGLLIFSGNYEIAVITRGLSNYLDKTDEIYKIGNKDKIISSFNTNENVKYQLNGACGVTYQGLIHFFGGNHNYENQHFGFDEKRNFVKYKNLEIDFTRSQCSTFKIARPNSQSGDKEVVLLCFDGYHEKNCFQYDDDGLTHFADAKENHYLAKLGKYKDQLVTVGDLEGHDKTEILERTFYGKYKWTFGPNYNFSPSGVISSYSMVNVPQTELNEEYLLLIGGKYSLAGKPEVYSDQVHKYNGKWSFFGSLQQKRASHGSVFLNGRVMIIGGMGHYNQWMKTETWDSSKSRFGTESTWPALNHWSTSNHLFITPDY